MSDELSPQAQLASILHSRACGCPDWTPTADDEDEQYWLLAESVIASGWLNRQKAEVWEASAKAKLFRLHVSDAFELAVVVVQNPGGFEDT